MALELSKKHIELEALKKTVISSHSLVVQEKLSETEVNVVEPSYLRVMQAE